MFFTVKNSCVQSISQGLHFSMSYDGFGSGIKTFSPDYCMQLFESFPHFMVIYLDTVSPIYNNSL